MRFWDRVTAESRGSAPGDLNTFIYLTVDFAYSFVYYVKICEKVSRPANTSLHLLMTVGEIHPISSSSIHHWLNRFQTL